MGSEPFTAARAAANEPTVPGTYAIAVNATAEPTPPAHETTATSSRFGLPHALVVCVCIATAALLAPPDMGIDDILLLIAGAGSIGAILGLAAGGRRHAGRISRAARAYFGQGN
ncbi:hypothetical protein [Streptomyces spectabilis]|uniref:Uncharacterized protein n=1 Tax=Streptomyces spectabilis TaxID=68270 RepID=A0A5P2X0U2_STRST|nr:hypothetical protein [Streptomyces spectabilis]MBB5108044.1 hypothetical protein [Streptomyces spectabilis]MCI3907856.1 hypothetical protein [Streptomyces spectabilis]MCI3907859.1 hypothetical protein [Streptomyces spectabilis]QEV57324.1 hypothetical protein CP982_00010 [Streptomyces spectabilis]GGV57137.1 hypothetical protein GCM10010245_90220 [Streptomyces spectabilis]